MAISREKFGILSIFEEIMSHIYKNLLLKIRYFSNQLQKKVRVLLVSCETMYLCSQLGGREILHIHKQPGKNPVILKKKKLFFMCDFSKENTSLFSNYYYYYFAGRHLKYASTNRIFFFSNFNVNVKNTENYIYSFLWLLNTGQKFSCK